MKDKVLQTIKQYHMTADNGSIVVGLSGGADSVCLLHLLSHLQDELQIQISACHVNHMLRGSEADRDEAFCRQLCDQLQIPLSVLKIDVPQIAQQQGKSFELAAREVRYAFFQETAACNHARIATAHTLSDSIETTLFHLARGTSLKGLCGIPPVRDNIIRPLIDCTRAEVEQYCAEHQLSYMNDTTNQDTRYSRNRLRHHVVPILYEQNPAFDRVFSNMQHTLREEDAYLDAKAQQLLESSRTSGGYSVSKLMQAENCILRRAAVQLLNEQGISVEHYRVKLILDHLEEQRSSTHLVDRYYCKTESDRFVIRAVPESQEYFEFPIFFEKDAEIHLFGNQYLQIQLLDQEKIRSLKKVNQKVLKFCIDCDKIYGSVFVRQRQAGDSIRQQGRGITKTLKKLFNETKMPVEMRDRLAVVSNAEHILWVEGFGADERCAISDSTTKAVILKVLEKRLDREK